VNYKCNYGDSVYVVGDIDELGNWNPQRAIKLTWSEGHNWSSKIRIIHDNRETIQYKYIIAPTILTGSQTANWERGPNRSINLYSTSKLCISLKDEWEHLKVRIAVQNDTLKRSWKTSQQMFISTNLSKKSFPIEMTLKQLTINGGIKENSFWTASFQIPYNITSFNYKLKITDSATKEVQVDRTSRKFDLKKFPSHISLNEVYAIEGSSFTKFDFRSGNSFNFDLITEEICVGSSPSSSQDIEELLANGVKAVLNLQTYGDMHRYSINWEQIKEQYQRAGITVEHYPILDMDNTDLSQKIQEAASLVEKLIREKGKLYVHCSAGKYRSPHTVIFYLWQYKQIDLDSAIELLKKKRRKTKVNIFEEIFAQNERITPIEEIKLGKAVSAVY